MRVVIDVSPLSHPRTGVGNYILGSLRGLVEAADGKHELVALAPTSPWGKGYLREAVNGLPVERREAVLPFSHAWRTGWSKLGWPPAERVVGAFDVLHFTDWMYPPQRGGVRSTMVHDLVPLRFPEWVTPRTYRMHAAKYRNMVGTCDVVFANSEYTKRDVVELVGMPEERVVVAHPAPEPDFRPEGERADLGRPYALTVATLEPRKNLDTLLRAHELLADEIALAVVGAEGWGPQPQLDRPGVIKLGYTSGEDLARLYRGASVVVYPSRFEGFGIPVLEAFASGVPCVASSHPSLDEAAGDAAIRADPDDADALAAAIREAIDRRDELVPRGLEHARGFTWRRVGETMLRAWEERL